MKKLGALLLVVLVSLGGIMNCPAVQAAAAEETEWAITVRELSEEEAAAFTGGMQTVQISDEINEPVFETNASYTAQEYSHTFGFYNGDLLVATATEVCTVWHYTDGKVHLYRRTITGSSVVSGYTIGWTYGSIVNTDGSRSYTSGDRATVSKLSNSATYALDFYITPSDYGFSCYAV